MAHLSKQDVVMMNRTVSRQLLDQGFTQSHWNPCLYTKEYHDHTTIDLTLYVDDAFITTDAGDLALEDIRRLDNRFGGTLKEDPEYFLGLKHSLRWPC